MDISKILSDIKGKALDAAHFDLLKHAYDLQNENIEQLKSNNQALKESNEFLEEKVKRLEKENESLRKCVPGKEVVLKDGSYYSQAGDGPFCTGCYDVKGQLVRLTKVPRPFETFGKFKCPSCHQYYGSSL
jgi:hypothetical protein